MSDYILSVKIDKEKLVSDAVSAWKTAEERINSEGITKLKITADEKTFFDSLKSLLSDARMFKGDVRVELDTGSYKKSLSTIEGYTGKTTDEIKKSFKQGFSDIEKYNLKDMFSGYVTSNKIKERISTLSKDITTSMSNLDTGDYKQVEGLLEKAKELQSIKEQISKDGGYSKHSNAWNKEADKVIKQAQDIYSQAVVKNGTSYISQINAEINKETDLVQERFNQLLELIYDSTGKVRENLSNAISSGVADGVNESKKHLAELERDLDRVNQKISELKKNKENTQSFYDDFSNKALSLRDKIDAGEGTDITKKELEEFGESARKYIATLDVTLDKDSSLYRMAKARYDDIASDLTPSQSRNLPNIYNMKTYSEILRDTNSEQSKLNLQIQEQQKLLSQQGNEQQVDSSIALDKEQLQQLVNYIDTVVIPAIERKTRAFTDEGTEVERVVNKEKTALGQLTKGIDDNSLDVLDGSASNNLLTVLNEIRESIMSISRTLGTIDDNSDIANLLNQFQLLLEKINEINEKGVNINTLENNNVEKNIDVKLEQRWRKKASELQKIYDSLLKDYGGNEQSLLLAINGKMNNGRNIDQFLETYSQSSINSLDSQDKVQRLSALLTYVQKIGNEAKNSEKLLDGLGNKTVGGKFYDFLQRTGKEKTRFSFDTIAKRIENSYLKEQNEIKSVEENIVDGTIKEEGGELDILLQKIREVLKSLSESNEYPITLTPKLSNNFDSMLQDQLNNRSFEISLNPKQEKKSLGASVELGQQGDAKKGIASNSLKLKSTYNETLDEGLFTPIVEEKIKQEKAFDNKAKEVVKKFLNGEEASSRAKSLLKEEIKQMIAGRHVDEINGNANPEDNFDAGALYDILKDDSTYTTNHFNEPYSEIKKYLRNTKIKYTDSDKAEFGDDWKDLQNTVGWGTLSKSKGMSPELIIREINNVYGKIFSGEYNNTQDALRAIYNYLQETPEKYANYYQQELEANGYQEVLDYDNKQLAEWTKDIKPPTSYMGEVNAESFEDYERMSATYAKQLDDENIELERSIELYNQEAEAAKIDAEAQNQLANAKGEVAKTSSQNTDVSLDTTTSTESAIQTEALKQEESQAEATAEARKELNKVREEGNQLPAVIPLTDNQELIKESFYKDVNPNKNIFSDGGARQSTELIKSESKELANLGTNAEKASQSKNKFALANSAVLASILKSLSALTSEGRGFQNIIDVLNNASFSDNAKTLINNYKELSSLYKQIKKVPEGSLESEEIKSRIAALNEQNQILETYVYTEQEAQQISTARSNATIAEKSAIDAKNKAEEDAVKAAKKLAESEEKAQQKAESLRLSLLGQLSSLKNNGKLMKVYGDEVNTMLSELSETRVAEDRLNRVRDRIREIKAEANQTGNTGKTFFQVLSKRFQSLATYLGSFASFYRIVGTIRQAITTIRELDTSLIDLRKTTKMSNGELEQFYKESNTIAIQTGVTTKEIITQAAAWSRLGYNTKEASAQMAELSSVFASISPGVDVENATDYLVSSMKAFGKTTDEVQRDIMDNINAIGKQILPKHMVTYGAKLIA